MTKQKAINRKSWSLLFYPLLRKELTPMDNEKLKKQEHDKHVSEKKLTLLIE